MRVGRPDEDVVEVELTTREHGMGAPDDAACAATRTGVEVTVRVEGRGRARDDAPARRSGDAAAAAPAGRSARASSSRRCSCPTPTEPVAVVRPAQAAATLGVLGDASPGRLHGIFSPAAAVPGARARTPRRGGDRGAGRRLVLAGRRGAGRRPAVHRAAVRADGRRLPCSSSTTTARPSWTGSFTTPTARAAARGRTRGHALRRHREDLVARGFAPGEPPAAGPAWWTEPIFCGWGAQCARAPLPGEPSSHPYYLQDLPPAVPPPGVPVGARSWRARTSTTSCSPASRRTAWSPGPSSSTTSGRPRTAATRSTSSRWPDLRGLDPRSGTHARPAGAAVVEGVGPGRAARRGVRARRDRPDRCRWTRATRRYRRTPGADRRPGCSGRTVSTRTASRSTSPSAARPGAALRPHPGPDGGAATWGVAGLHPLLAALHRAAKATKPDALVVTHTPHPAFADVTDMVRLNDVLERDTSTAMVPVADQLRFRHAVATAALPAPPGRHRPVAHARPRPVAVLRHRAGPARRARRSTTPSGSTGRRRSSPPTTSRWSRATWREYRAAGGRG